MIERFANNARTTLNGAITSSTLTLVVTSAASFPTLGQFRILIDAELLLVTAVTGNTFTVTRGVEGTSAIGHANLSSVSQIITAGALSGLLPVAFNDSVIGANSNISNLRPNAAAIDNTQQGITNLASDTSSSLPGLRASFATGWGDQITVRGEYGTAGGWGSTCDATGGVAIGYEAIAHSGSTGTVAIGEIVVATGEGAIAMGSNSQAAGIGAVALGFGSVANGTNSISIAGGLCSDLDCIAIGSGCVAHHFAAGAIGIFTQSFSGSSLALNEDTVTFQQRSIAAGFNSETAGERAMALGSICYAGGFGSACVGIQGAATADGQLCLSGGTFLQTQETNGGDAQSSWRVLRGTTPGYDINETIAFAGGVGANIPWAPTNGRCYHVRLSCVVSGILMPSRTRVSCTFTQEANVSMSTGGTLLTAPTATALQTTTNPGPPVDLWTFGLHTDGSILFQTFGSRAQVMAECTIEYQEVQFPILAPTELSGCTLWLESQQGVTLDSSGKVTAWNDQSGVGNNYTAAGTAQRPSYPANIANTEHAVRFDGIANVLTASGKTLANMFDSVGGDYTLFLVGSLSSTSSAPDPKNRPCLFAESSGVFGVSSFTSADITLFHTDVTSEKVENINSVNIEPIPNLYTAWFGTQGQWRILRAQGDLYETVGALEATNLSSFSGVPILGANYNQTEFCTCDLFEVITYSRQLTRQERVQVLNYLNLKWGTEQFSPTGIDTHTLLWYRGDMGISLSGSNVTAWANSGLLSDPNTTIVPPAPINQPLFNQSDSAYNYQPTLTFSGSQALFSPAPLASAISQPTTTYVVGEVDVANGVLVCGDTSSRNEIFANGTNWSAYAGAELDTSSSTIVPSLVIVTFNGVTSNVWVTTLNTGAAASGNIGTSSLTLISVGAIYNGGALLSPLTGKVAEYIVRQGVDGLTTMAQIANYLKRRYGL